MPEEQEKKEYDVTATDMHGKASRSTEEAASVGSLVERLRAGGVQVSKVTGRRGRRLFEPRRCDLDEFAFFNSELASACKRGVPLPGALRALSRDMSGWRVREALRSAASDVEGGVDIAEALARRSDVFPPGYVALVEAGLKAGDLAGTLLLFAEEARLSAEVRRRTVRLVLYPLAVLFAASGLLALAGWYLLPAFGDMFAEMGDLPLPAVTRFHLRLAPYYRWAPLILLGQVIVLPLVWSQISRSAGGARAVGRFVLGLPVVGRFYRAVAVARFCRTLATALAGHVPVPEAITLAGLGSGNAAIQAASKKLREAVMDGSRISDGLAEEMSLFPATVIWTLHIAEQRGELGSALEECARLLDDQARRFGEVVTFFVSGIVIVAAVVLLLQGAFAMMQPLVKLMEMLA
ncbi:MAG: type II secretion system F family protein [Planctomycetota bacterium]